MATYTELAVINTEAEWNGFTDKVMIATLIKAATILDAATPAAEELAWAKNTIANQRGASKGLVYYIVAKHDNATISGILGASDSTIQNEVDAAIDKINGV